MKQAYILSLFLTLLFSSCKKKDSISNWTCTLQLIDEYTSPGIPNDTTTTVTPYSNLTQAQAAAVCKQQTDTIFSQYAITLQKTTLTEN